MITREEFIQWLVLSQGWPHTQKTAAFGNEMPMDRWSNVYIRAALQNGVIKLDGEGLLDAADRLYRSDMAVMAARALKLKNESAKIKIKDEDPYWPNLGLIHAAVNKKVVLLDSKGALNYSDSVTRAEAAATIFKMMQMKK